MMEKKPVEYWVKKLELMPHPEGGYFKQTYISNEKIDKEALPDRYAGKRAFSTAIYFLIESGNFSAFHKIASDELWHFYYGDSMVVHIIHPDGAREDIHLGSNADEGEVFQAVVPAGTWFGSRMKEGNEYALVGCTVAPGFDFEDFELAKYNELTATYPEHEALISKLTRQ
ncbi:cupin domain-containing protein [Flammeovirgaceae bacterium SG7u.111]|nr:cupin domain-containing protein [Flammeovirgaceae bacterium SG7u.132]WPO36323.1 cupin domain-containing protein [Flammeovirgaceae bacterium SG7u.111]